MDSEQQTTPEKRKIVMPKSIGESGSVGTLSAKKHNKQQSTVIIEETFGEEAGSASNPSKQDVSRMNSLIKQQGKPPRRLVASETRQGIERRSSQSKSSSPLR
jgi:hypothetical protein